MQELRVQHQHGGSPGDGRRIPARNVQDIYRYKFVMAADFESSNANVSISTQNGFTAAVFADAATGVASCTFMIPPYKRSISGIKLHYYNDTASSDVRLQYDFTRGRTSIADVSDSLTYAQYTTTADTGRVEVFSVPKTAWDGLGDLKEFDLIGFQVSREGADVNDTYNADFDILGALVEFA